MLHLYNKPNSVRAYLIGDFKNSKCAVYLFTYYGTMKFTPVVRTNRALQTLQEDQTIRTFAIFKKFLILKLLLGATEKFTFSSIQPISVKKNLIKYGDPTYVETFMDPIRMIQIINVFHQLLILSPT